MAHRERKEEENNHIGKTCTNECLQTEPIPFSCLPMASQKYFTITIINKNTDRIINPFNPTGHAESIQ